MEYKSRVYQPERLSLSSSDSSIINQQDSQSPGYYSEFVLNLKNPILNVKSLQLLRASIPLALPSIPDTQCVFWYYRLPNINGSPIQPVEEALKLVRLLPSTYPQELFVNAANYGFNQYFQNASQLVTELNKAATADPLTAPATLTTANILDIYTPGDITFGLTQNSNSRIYFQGNYANQTPSPVDIPDNALVTGDVYVINTLADINWEEIGYDGTPVVGGYFWYNGEVITGTGGQVETVSYSYLPSYYNDTNVAFAQELLYNVSGNPDDTGLPGQPFKPFNGRSYSPNEDNAIRNSILPTLTTRLGYNYNQATSSQLLFQQTVRPQLTGSASTSLVSTANGPFNLTYTANCNMYCNLASSSAYDSAGNSGLLSVVPLNAPTLGIAYYNNVLNNPLTKVVKDIYEIRIRLVDDNGDALLLPESAIVNLEIGFTFV